MLHPTRCFFNRFFCFGDKKKVDSPTKPDEDSNKIIQWEDTTPFVVPITGGQVIKVYDGDTITVASRLPFANSPLYRFSVRLNGIDTPEIKGKTDDEKSVAVEARDTLSEMILHKNVVLKNVASEKYGRVLADVYFNDLHINNWLIDQRFAVKYDGGTKKIPESWVQYHVGDSNQI